MGKDVGALTPENAVLLMNYALNYYVKRHDVVLRKLSHAKDATQESVKEIEKSDAADAETDKKIVEAYDGMWNEIIATFRDCGVSDEELEKIEVILSRIPVLIKQYYDVLVQEDGVLQELVKELESPEYKRAMQIIRKVQMEPDKLSGLDPNEFDLDLKDIAKAFILRPHALRDGAH